jgi:hypothetical protein
MSELSRVGQNHNDSKMAAPSSTNSRGEQSKLSLLAPNASYPVLIRSIWFPIVSAGGSSSSWQAQWLAQSSCGTKDVLRCVCCRLTFPSLAALSTHMKEANHGPPIPSIPSPKGPPPSQTPPSVSHPKAPLSPNESLLLKGITLGFNSFKSYLRTPCIGMLSKNPCPPTETVHLPRKLVRGQDVWLGKGAEQTRQILKCMWCGQSFRSLAEMTSHMQQTQHYTNIISQEQLISWRSSEDKSSSPNSHVSAVLTCKVCDQVITQMILSLSLEYPRMCG